MRTFYHIYSLPGECGYTGENVFWLTVFCAEIAGLITVTTGYVPHININKAKINSTIIVMITFFIFVLYTIGYKESDRVWNIVSRL